MVDQNSDFVIWLFCVYNFLIFATDSKPIYNWVLQIRFEQSIMQNPEFE